MNTSPTTTSSHDEKPPLQRTPQHRAKVLVVDDEVHIVESLAMHLSRTFDVTTATSGHDALALLAEGHMFAVVVTDMRMPGLDGVALLRRFQQTMPDTVRMVLTGRADMDAALSAINEGHIYRFLTKPCQPKKLIGAISDGVDQHRRITADRDLVFSKLDRMQGKMLHAERLATLGTMVAAISHELGNWTAAFQGVLSIVKDKASDGVPPSEEDLRDLSHVGKHLAAHAKSFLHLARPQEQKDEHFDLCEAVADTVNLLRSAGITRHARVDVDLSPTPVYVKIDRTSLEQVVVNLIKNALDAMRDCPERGSRLRVTVSADVDHRLACCKITDNGTGIDPAAQAKVFEAYYTSKSAGQGTGLGLPVVRQIMESFGGSISLSSTVGEGTTFAFELPSAK